MAYKYRQSEIESMKRDILAHCATEIAPDENGNLSAWRLRAALEGLAYCTICTKREKARRLREIALFDRLTTNNLPNFDN